MSALALSINSDNLITLVGLTNGADSTFINSATVSATLKDSFGVNVTGQAWPLTLDYVASSNGNYQGTLQDVLALSASNYTALVVADSGAGLHREWTVPLTAEISTG